eukprot:5210453-Pyramimonas_sp.AAC.1
MAHPIEDGLARARGDAGASELTPEFTPRARQEETDKPHKRQVHARMETCVCRQQDRRPHGPCGAF